MSRIALILIGSAVLLVLVIGTLGPSVAQSELAGGPAWLPPYHLNVAPPALLVTVVLMIAMVLAVAGLILALRALDRGWRPPIIRLTVLGSIATVLMIIVPPMGSTDVLFYAAYGRLAATGGNPYVDTAQDLIDRGDPIGLATEGLRWTETTSVYGPLTTGLQTLASSIGGSSVHTTVFVFTAAGAIGYLITGVLLRRLAGDDRVRQARVALLWTVNPVLLFIAVNSGHADTVGIPFAVAALYAASRKRFVAAGLLVAAACAIKITFGLYVLALVLVLHRWPKRLAAVLISGAALGAVAYLIVGPEAISSTLLAGSKYASASPLRWPLYPLSALIGLEAGVRVIVIVGWLLLFVFAVLLYRLMPTDAAPDLLGEPDLLGRVIPVVTALNVAWVLTSAYALPWYDVTGWATLTLLVGSRLVDRVLLIRTSVLVCAYLPGAAYVMPPATELLTDVARTIVGPAVGIALMSIVIWQYVRHQRADTPGPDPVHSTNRRPGN
jgi:hypothetical protein